MVDATLSAVLWNLQFARTEKNGRRAELFRMSVLSLVFNHQRVDDDFAVCIPRGAQKKPHVEIESNLVDSLLHYFLHHLRRIVTPEYRALNGG